MALQSAIAAGGLGLPKRSGERAGADKTGARKTGARKTGGKDWRARANRRWQAKSWPAVAAASWQSMIRSWQSMAAVQSQRPQRSGSLARNWRAGRRWLRKHCADWTIGAGQRRLSGRRLGRPSQRCKCIGKRIRTYIMKSRGAAGPTYLRAPARAQKKKYRAARKSNNCTAHINHHVNQSTAIATMSRQPPRLRVTWRITDSEQRREPRALASATTRRTRCAVGAVSPATAAPLPLPLANTADQLSSPSRPPRLPRPEEVVRRVRLPACQDEVVYVQFPSPPPPTRGAVVVRWMDTAQDTGHRRQGQTHGREGQTHGREGQTDRQEGQTDRHRAGTDSRDRQQTQTDTDGPAHTGSAGSKAGRRKTTGTGRMRHLSTMTRRFKNSFQTGTPDGARGPNMVPRAAPRRIRRRPNVSERREGEGRGEGGRSAQGWN